MQFAAALVPPIATSGIDLGLWMEGLVWGQTGSESWERLALSLGAMVLFLTNIVAIILGTAMAFWAVGIDSRVEAKPEDTRHKRRWPRFWFVTFVILSILLSGMMTWLNGIVREHEKTTPPSAAGAKNPDSPISEPLE